MLATRTPLTDEALVARVRAGDDGAFTEIVQRYEAPLTGFARMVLGGAHHDAEECVQDAFVRALRSLRSGTAASADREMALRPWLHTIVRNRCLDQLRAGGKRPTTDLEPHEPVLRAIHADPASMIARREALDEVVGALGDLPTRQRRALVLHELEDQSHSQIGRALGVTRGASKALVHRARAGLATHRAA
ncbi:RNA polymerase sigma factor [Conexibacter sp. SYSU D00693]|uniref:RNA polymerase sigma factor n=1 Tax=Conexibacter sp. SYSU D00693 TaxID=2812560 RepID=UPI00196A1EB5|nr:RNA polymerase sigma factor [Conexibacter sp. SYSU D00693]